MIYLFKDRTAEYQYEGDIKLSISHEYKNYSIKLEFVIPNEIFPDNLEKNLGVLHLYLKESDSTLEVDLGVAKTVLKKYTYITKVTIYTNFKLTFNYDW